MKLLKYSIKIKSINLKNLKNLKLNKKIINVIDVKYSYKKKVAYSQRYYAQSLIS